MVHIRVDFEAFHFEFNSVHVDINIHGDVMVLTGTFAVRADFAVEKGDMEQFLK